MRKHLLVLLLLLASLSAYAQHPVIRGSITDTLNHKKLQGAAITLIRAKDSILSTFTRSGADGSFILHPDSAGSYFMLITYPAFADFTDNLVVTDGQTLELGSVPMATKARVLEEFVLHKKQGAIMLKGDTTEYAADSFKVQEGATVDALLKKLPGIQVDRNGGITAQGEKVQKVLVDGEEFFSDDPAVVTQSLQAKTVDAVQVYDKKSDATILTGIEDGQLQKTINLKLKENMKKGFFGKLVAGGGTDGYYENQGMINAFKGKRQISAFGIVSNTGKIGLGWSDRSKYGGSDNNMTYDEESGNYYSYYNSSDDDDLSGNWSGQYGGEGLPSAWTGGIHYANKWNEGKEHLSGNYRYAKQNVEAVGNTFTQYILPDSQYFSNQRRTSFTSAQRHGGDGLFDLKIDSNSTLQATVNADYIHNIKNSETYTETIGGDGALINSSGRNLTNDATSQSINSTLLYRKKFRKKGRNIFAQVRENYKITDGSGYLFTDSRFYNGGGTNDTINQRKTAHTEAFSLYGKASYTEPLSKVAFLNVGYSINLSNSNSDRFSFNRSGGDWSDAPDSIYSSSYKYMVTTQSGSLALNVKLKKYNFTLGGDVFNTDFHQQDLLHDTTFSRNYNNFSPKASFSWEIKKQTRLRLNYQGSTRQPTLEQIQPLRQNTDPLNVAIGNPDLKQSFNNNISLNYNSYQVLTGQYVYAGGGLNFVHDAISQTQFTDEFGRRTYQYINVNGNYNGWMYLGADHKFKKGNFRLGLNSNINVNYSNNFVNGLKNTSDNNTYTVGLSFNKDWTKNDKEVAGIEISPDVSYNDNHATISTLATSYWSSDIRAEFHTDLPWKLKVNTSVNASFREKTVEFDRNNNVVRWDAWIARKLLKGDVMEVRLSVYDILNQNIGYSRRGVDNYITENSYNTIRRYGLLSIVWNFSSTPATVKKDEDDD